MRQIQHNNAREIKRDIVVKKSNQYPKMPKILRACLVWLSWTLVWSPAQLTSLCSWEQLWADVSVVLHSQLYFLLAIIYHKNERKNMCSWFQIYSLTCDLSLNVWWDILKKNKAWKEIAEIIGATGECMQLSGWRARRSHSGLRLSEQGGILQIKEEEGVLYTLQLSQILFFSSSCSGGQSTGWAVTQQRGLKLKSLLKSLVNCSEKVIQLWIHPVARTESDLSVFRHAVELLWSFCELWNWAKVLHVF